MVFCIYNAHQKLIISEKQGKKMRCVTKKTKSSQTSDEKQDQGWCGSKRSEFQEIFQTRDSSFHKCRDKRKKLMNLALFINIITSNVVSDVERGIRLGIISGNVNFYYATWGFVQWNCEGYWECLIISNGLKQIFQWWRDYFTKFVIDKREKQ